MIIDLEMHCTCCNAKMISSTVTVLLFDLANQKKKKKNRTSMIEDSQNHNLQAYHITLLLVYKIF